MKFILIPGGAGFIGKSLTERFLKRGDTVVAIDNLDTGGIRDVLMFQNQYPDRYFFYKQDIINADIEALEQGQRFDEIYNMACPATPSKYQADPVHTLLTSISGVHNLLEYVRKCGGILLQSSTSEVYGDALVSPQPESYWGNVNTVGPRSCYDEGKRCAETLIHDYCTQYGTRAKIVRIFNTYGPFMSNGDGRVMTNFIVQALDGKPITIYGDGNQTRSFQYVDDLVDALMIMVENSPEDLIGPVNIGNPEEVTIKELAEKVIGITGSKSSIEYYPLPVDDPKQRRPDISLAKSVLGWEPKISLSEGIVRMVDAIKKSK